MIEGKNELYAAMIKKNNQILENKVYDNGVKFNDADEDFDKKYFELAQIIHNSNIPNPGIITEMIGFAKRELSAQGNDLKSTCSLLLEQIKFLTSELERMTGLNLTTKQEQTGGENLPTDGIFRV